MTELTSASATAPPPQANVAALLREVAAARPYKKAVVTPCGRDAAGRRRYVHLTFQQLDAESDRYAHGLRRAGVGVGSRVLVFVPPGLDFFALTFAVFKVGAVLVLIDPGIGRVGLAEALRPVQPEAFIGVPRAHLLRLLHPSSFRSVRLPVTAGPRLGWGGLCLRDLRADDATPFPMAETTAASPAAILFTSGSTGPPKGALYTHGNFLAQIDTLRRVWGYGPDDTDLATFPLFALFDAGLGMTAVIPDMDATRPGSADPVNIIEAITDHGATTMFGSPALLARLCLYGRRHGLRLPSLRTVASAGAPVPPATLDTLRGFLCAEANVFTPYGATESLPIASIESRDILGVTAAKTGRGWGTCVGKPVDGVEVRVIGVTDDPIETMDSATLLPPGDIGEFIVSGSVVTREYYNQPEATRLAKIRDGERVWHRVGDCGYVDAAGNLWFCGRKSHRVVTAGGVLFTEPVEGIVNTHPAVARSALVGVGRAPNQQPVVVVELREDNRFADEREIIREIQALMQTQPITCQIRSVLVHPRLPVDVRHNSKIIREKLAQWAAGRLA
ncbi:MAG: fatty acid CoA ligase family protein [Candidatus Sumerlaeaceae bacterium]|nr:fatty acid CoA ligase family protein [Candidatus Sumerlaeaceae bacterium]